MLPTSAWSDLTLSLLGGAGTLSNANPVATSKPNLTLGVTVGWSLPWDLRGEVSWSRLSRTTSVSGVEYSEIVQPISLGVKRNLIWGLAVGARSGLALSQVHYADAAFSDLNYTRYIVHLSPKLDWDMSMSPFWGLGAEVAYDWIFDRGQTSRLGTAMVFVRVGTLGPNLGF